MRAANAGQNQKNTTRPSTEADAITIHHNFSRVPQFPTDCLQHFPVFSMICLRNELAHRPVILSPFETLFWCSHLPIFVPTLTLREFNSIADETRPAL
jgi:hypothetical protein